MEAIEIIEPDSTTDEEICNLLIRSISQSCEKDHHNDTNLLREWLENKTSENVNRWLESNKTYCTILESGAIVGVLQINIENRILLNYVDPKFLGKGIGTKMLQKLEADLGEGSKMLVESSETAKTFYEQRGFIKVEGNANELFKQIFL